MTIIVEWEEINFPNEKTEAVSYNVSRSPDNTPNSFVFQANVPSNVYADASGSTTDFYSIFSVDIFGDEGKEVLPITQYSLTAPSQEIAVCKLFGTVLDITGHPDPDVVIAFEIKPSNAPQTEQLTGFNTKTIHRSTNPQGYFEINLAHDVIVIMHIKQMRKRFQFVVPQVSTIDFKDLVGVELAINNPF